MRVSATTVSGLLARLDIVAGHGERLQHIDALRHGVWALPKSHDFSYMTAASQSFATGGLDGRSPHPRPLSRGRGEKYDFQPRTTGGGRAHHFHPARSSSFTTAPVGQSPR